MQSRVIDLDVDPMDVVVFHVQEKLTERVYQA